MNRNQQLFAPPIPPRALNDDEIRQLREHRADAQRATDTIAAGRQADAARAANLARAIRDGRCLAPVPYFTRPAPARPVATNSRHRVADAQPATTARPLVVDWSRVDWATQNALVQAAMAELRRARAAK